MNRQHIDEIRHTTELGTWLLTRARPSPALAESVVEYWEVQGRLSPFREAVLPNGCTEMMINLGPRHRVFQGLGTGVWDRSWFSGLHERAIFIESLEGTHLVSARLHPFGAVTLFGVRAAQAANTIVDLETLVGREAMGLRSALRAAETPAARFVILEEFVRGRQTNGFLPPPFVREAAARIERAHGDLRVAALHRGLDVSRKHLAVSFRRCFGVSAKAYARIRRFVWTLERLRQSTGVEWSRLAVEAGYSDQSHLVRDFRRIGAASPTEYLQRFAPDGDALLESPRNKSSRRHRKA